MIVEVSKASAILTSTNTIKLLRTKVTAILDEIVVGALFLPLLHWWAVLTPPTLKRQISHEEKRDYV